MTDVSAGDGAPIQQLPPPGWYPDPTGSPQERWWGGEAWSEAYRPLANAFPPLSPTQPRWRPELGRHFPTIARLTEISLAASIAAAAFSAFSSLRFRSVMERWIADTDSIDVADGEAVDRLEMLSGFVTLLTLAVTAALFITWLYRAHRSDQVHAPTLQHGSGWAIGGWFVPFLNVVRPAQMVGEVTRAAALAKNAVPISGGLVVTWWALYLSGNALTTLASIMIGDADRKDGAALLAGYRDSATVDAFGDFLWIAAGILALLIVRRTTRMLLSRSADQPA